jgi:tetratricopeptide (TPR) repeat protein
MVLDDQRNEREQYDEHNEGHDKLDSELAVGYAPKLAELIAVSRDELSRWLAYVEGEPPLDKLRVNAQKIGEAIQIASGLDGLEQLAAKLALAVDIKFERLGIWRAWYPRLMALYESVVGQGDALAQSQLFQCLMRHHLRQGNLTSSNHAINFLLDIAQIDPSVPLQEAMIGAVSVSTLLSGGEESLVLAEQLFSLARLTRDYLLMAKTFNVLGLYYANKHDPIRTFECGQMTYFISTMIGREDIALSGLHYMGIAFQIGEQPQRAFRYLREAVVRARRTGDIGDLQYIEYTWGTCCYVLGKYRLAMTHLNRCVDYFAGRGTYHATTRYMLGLCYMRLERFVEAENALNAARAEWKKLNQPFDELYARHALAHVYFLQGRYPEAVEEAEQTLAEAQKTDNIRRDYLVDQLTQDLEKYRVKLHS